ncbi:MAG: hypothetical protein U5L06_08275 [Rhodovibrio sp.]|nr:hypothetical protein [Rhodovibrio sp.]
MRRSRRAGALLAVLVALGGCASGSDERDRPADAEAPGIAQARELGRFAMDRGRFADAARMFEQGLSEARARDDIQAIADLGYARALAELRAGDAGAAARQAGRLRRELTRRDQPVPARLDLVLAEARYRLDSPQGSRAAARRVLAASGDPLLTGRAHYLLGMISADAGNQAGLAEAHRAMAGAQAPALRADRDVLAGRLAQARGEPAAALERFTDAAERRRRLGDELGMARALAFAGTAARDAGRRAQAADLFYRAGRTAALRDRHARARAWLKAAIEVAEAADARQLATDARDVLDGIPKGE